MKRIAILLLAVLLLAACVPTPEEEIVANKAEGRLEDLIDTDAVEAYALEDEARSLRSLLGAPETVQEELSSHVWGGTLHIDIDATVEIPDVSAFPVCLIGEKRFSAEQKERFVKSVLGDGPYYEFNRSIAERDDYKRCIERYQNIIEDLWNSPNGTMEEKQSWVNDMEVERNQFVRALQKLQVDETMHPWSGSFGDEHFGVASYDNSHATVYPDLISYERSGVVAEFYAMHHSICTDAEQQAAETAQAYLSERFDTVLVPMSISRMEDADGADGRLYDQSHTTYTVEFLPQYNGICCFPGETEHGSDTARQAAGYASDYSQQLPRERVEVYLYDGEVVGFTWYAPMEIQSTENENVTLLPFPKVMEIFRSHVFMNYYLDKLDGVESEDTITVRKVRLCYALIRKADSEDFYLMPVWDFALDAAWLSEDGAWHYETACVLSINTVDGSLVDRQIGY
ncbi:MAG: hypothetical protein IKZ44_03200 [Clostridia bacterium]|nr:hypothetical protein [Clostridia bacterium]